MKRIVFIIMITFIATVTIAQSNSQNSVVPEWAKKAVWYQIFPERFANGGQSQ